MIFQFIVANIKPNNAKVELARGNVWLKIDEFKSVDVKNKLDGGSNGLKFDGYGLEFIGFKSVRPRI